MGKRHNAKRTPKRDSSGSSKLARPHTTKQIAEASSKHTHSRDTHARDTVLHIPELLQLVLSYLPPKEIVTLQRVSLYWKGVITASPEIQEILFFRLRPAGRPFETWELVDATFNRVRLVQEDPAFPSLLRASVFKIPQVQHTQDDANSRDPELFLPVALSPLMMSRNISQTGSVTARLLLVEIDRIATSRMIDYTCGESVRYKGKTAVLQRNASMYLTDPPCHAAEVYIRLFSRDQKLGPGLLYRTKIECNTGLRIEDVVEGLGRGEAGYHGIHEDLEYVMIDGSRFDADEGEVSCGGGEPRGQLITLGGVNRNTSRGPHRWWCVARNPTVELDIVLTASASPGLLPIVPTAEEVSAVFRR